MFSSLLDVEGRRRAARHSIVLACCRTHNKHHHTGTETGTDDDRNETQLSTWLTTNQPTNQPTTSKQASKQTNKQASKQGARTEEKETSEHTKPVAAPSVVPCWKELISTAWRTNGGRRRYTGRNSSRDRWRFPKIPRETVLLTLTDRHSQPRLCTARLFLRRVAVDALVLFCRFLLLLVSSSSVSLQARGIGGE